MIDQYYTSGSCFDQAAAYYKNTFGADFSTTKNAILNSMILIIIEIILILVIIALNAMLITGSRSWYDTESVKFIQMRQTT